MYPKYAFLFDRVGDTRQNQLTMKYRSLWSTKKYKVTRSVKLNKYQKYDAYLLDRARYIRQKSMGHVI